MELSQTGDTVGKNVIKEFKEVMYGMNEIYDATKDEQFSKAYIDIDEPRIRELDNGRRIPYRRRRIMRSGSTNIFRPFRGRRRNWPLLQ